jgi:hypothetical protein
VSGQYELELSSEEPTTMDDDLKLELQVVIGGGGKCWNSKERTKLFRVVHDMRGVNFPGQQHHLRLKRRFLGIRIERPQL